MRTMFRKILVAAALVAALGGAATGVQSNASEPNVQVVATGCIGLNCS